MAKWWFMMVYVVANSHAPFWKSKISQRRIHSTRFRIEFEIATCSCGWHQGFKATANRCEPTSWVLQASTVDSLLSCIHRNCIHTIPNHFTTNSIFFDIIYNNYSINSTEFSHLYPWLPILAASPNHNHLGVSTNGRTLKWSKMDEIFHGRCIYKWMMTWGSNIWGNSHFKADNMGIELQTLWD